MTVEVTPTIPAPSNPPLVSTDLLAYFRWVSLQPLTVVDLETTGSIARRNRVIEVSVLQGNLQDGIQYQQTDLINPQVPIPASITRFTGISQAMIDPAPVAAEVWPQYLSRLSEGVLTAHNLEFDYAFLQAEYRRLKTQFSRPQTEQLCTVQLSRLLLADLPSRSLPRLVEHFGFEVGPSHRAEADTLACWYLAQRLLTEIQNEPDDRLLARFAQQWLGIKQAAAILGCRQKQARSLLEQSGAESRPSARGGPSSVYQRGDIERILLDHFGSLQERFSDNPDQSNGVAD